MVTLYCKAGCPRCRSLEEALRHLAVQCCVVSFTPADPRPDELPEGMHLPVLRDGDELFQGAEEILAHLDELTDFKEWWYKFQSDACYCDE